MNNDTFIFNCIAFVVVILALLIAPSITPKYREILLLVCCGVSMFLWVANCIQANEVWDSYVRLKAQRAEEGVFVEKLYNRVLYLENFVKRQRVDLSDAEWKFILKQIHPDKHQNDSMAQSVTRKLIELRKKK